MYMLRQDANSSIVEAVGTPLLKAECRTSLVQNALDKKYL